MPEADFEESAEVAEEVIRETVHADEKPDWVKWTAMSAMVMALMSAVGALLAGITANEALLTRTGELIEVIDRDRDQVEIEILDLKRDVLAALGRPMPEEDLSRMSLAEEAERLTEEIRDDELEVERIMHAHEMFAIGVTLLSVAITLSGMAIVSTRRRVWYVGLVFGTVGALIVGSGIIDMVTA